MRKEDAEEEEKPSFPIAEAAILWSVGEFAVVEAVQCSVVKTGAQ